MSVRFQGRQGRPLTMQSNTAADHAQRWSNFRWHVPLNETTLKNTLKEGAGRLIPYTNIKVGRADPYKVEQHHTDHTKH